jgi:hypothetical protein
MMAIKVKIKRALSQFLNNAINAIVVETTEPYKVKQSWLWFYYFQQSNLLY